MEIRTLFKCPIKIDFVNETKGNGIIATQNISKFSVVLIETVAYGTPQECGNLLSKTPKIMKQLIPINGTALDKVRMTSYSDNNGKEYVGNFLSFFNHNCQPNCVLFPDFLVHKSDVFKYGFLSMRHKFENSIPFITVFAVKDIHKGEELCLNYGDFIHHQNEPRLCKYHTFTCDCGSTLEKRSKMKLVLDGIARQLAFDTNIWIQVLKLLPNIEWEDYRIGITY